MPFHIPKPQRASYTVLRATGTADDVRIQAAIDACAAAGGGKIELRNGTYRIAATLVFPFDSRVTLEGERMARTPSGGVTFKTSASVTLEDMVQVTGEGDPIANADLSHDVVIENICFDGNNTTTNIFKLTNQDTIKFFDCRLIQATNSVVTVWDSEIDPTASTIPGGIYFDTCNISANGGIGIDLQYQTQCWVIDSWFTGSSVDTWINMVGSNKLKIANVEFNTATQALHLQDTATFPTNDITIASTIFAVGTGNRAWKESRTHAASVDFVVQGTAPAGVIYDSLVGTGNEIHLGRTFYSQGNVTGATTFNRVNGETIVATLTGNITVTLSSGGYKGDHLTLKLTQDGTGSRTATWPSNFKKAGGTLTLSTGIGAVDVIDMVWDGTNWYERSRALNLS